ncbi:uncharacterized protein [Amphiura filiformis]|uniref:uncharacterized protein n=1 Tax=Amphiura filiformis TaxID=82378 RepID=UPI003B218DE5
MATESNQQTGDKTNHIVFVYGTLRRGHKNQYVLTERGNGQAVYVGQARTVEKWPLVIGTKFNIPFVLYKPGYGHNVIGEIYKVDNKMLKHLDWFEDSPSWYKRRKLFVTMKMDQHSLMNTTSASSQDHTAKDIPANPSAGGDFSEMSVDEKIECWGYVLEDFKEDLEKQEYYADYSEAVKKFGYEKEMEDEEEHYLEYVTSVTLK